MPRRNHGIVNQMVIARSLTTLLSFKVDKRGFNNFNSLIGSVKTNLLTTGALLTGTFGAVTKILSNMATSILDTDEFARSTGLATRELIGLQKAGEKFRINPEEFNAALGNLDSLRKDAVAGSGALFDIAQQTGIAIRDERGNILPLLNIFDNLIGYLNKVTDATERSRIAFNLFGNIRFADIAKNGVDAFTDLRKSMEPLAAEFEKNKEGALRFEQSFQGLINSGKQLAYQVFPPLFNTISRGFEEVSKLFDAFGRDIENLKKDPGQIFRTSAQRARLLQQQNEGQLDKLNGVFQRPDQDALRRNIEVSNTINIQVPPGTPDAQAAFLQATAQESFDAMFNNRFLDILSDNPQTE